MLIPWLSPKKKKRKILSSSSIFIYTIQYSAMCVCVCLYNFNFQILRLAGQHNCKNADEKRKKWKKQHKSNFLQAKFWILITFDVYFIFILILFSIKYKYFFLLLFWLDLATRCTIFYCYCYHRIWSNSFWCINFSSHLSLSNWKKEVNVATKNIIWLKTSKWKRQSLLSIPSNKKKINFIN